MFRRFARLGAADAGVVLPGRYVDDDATRAADRVRNEAALVSHALRLADRIGGVLDDGATPLVLGGDCSILLGVGVALARRGRTGLVHVDGHTDFRHPGNSDDCASVAGEDLAAAVGLHRPTLTDLDGLSPYFAPSRTVHVGHRDDDDEADETRRVLGLVLSARQAMAMRPADAASAIRSVAGSAGYWLQLDVDVLDPAVMPAVDSPDPGGFPIDDLAALLSELAPGAVGASVTVFDPDLDPDGRYARVIADLLVGAFERLGAGA
ncbi:arginase [Agromyces sp. Leaf222]|nr:arginase [Agromyces sp. Leaf222]